MLIRKLTYAVTLITLQTITLSCIEAASEKNEWIDLTHAFSEDTLYWPTSKPFELEKKFYGTTEKGYFYSAFQFCSAEHGGTHIDAPIHFSEGKQTLDEISVDKLMGQAIILDVTIPCSQNADYLVTVKDFQNFEKQHGEIPQQSIILINTGYHQFWPNAKEYLGTNERGADAVKKLHFPGLSVEAAQWLVENKKAKAIGIDTASIDYGQSTLFEAHRVLANQNIPIFENIARLSELSHGAYIIALPIKIKSGSGGPLRIIAKH